MNILYKYPRSDETTYIVTSNHVLASFYPQNIFKIWGKDNSLGYNKEILKQTCKKILIYD